MRQQAPNRFVALRQAVCLTEMFTVHILSALIEQDTELTFCELAAYSKPFNLKTNMLSFCCSSRRSKRDDSRRKDSVLSERSHRLRNSGFGNLVVLVLNRLCVCVLYSLPTSCLTFLLLKFVPFAAFYRPVPRHNFEFKLIAAKPWTKSFRLKLNPHKWPSA